MSKRSPITTHILDTSIGKPVENMKVKLEFEAKKGKWENLSEETTNGDGRIENLLKPGFTVKSGSYRLTFSTLEYFSGNKSKFFYPEITIVFQISDTKAHYHVPLLLSPYGYSTYRGS